MKKHEKRLADDRVELVLRVLLGETSLEEAAVEHDTTISEIEIWKRFYLRAASSATGSDRVGGKSAMKRNRPRTALGVCVAAVAALALLYTGAVIAADGGCPNGLPFCFRPDQPAKASEVNENFAQLKEWTEQKVGVFTDTDIRAYRYKPEYSTWSATGAGGAAIVNDNQGYQKLMIVGNDSAGGTREVGIWDNLTVVDHLTVGGNVSASGTLTANHIAGPSFIHNSHADATTVRVTCPVGKTIVWASGFVNDYHTACSAPVSNANKAVPRCSKETILHGCNGASYCDYVGTANGCGSAGHTCAYALCM